MVVFVIQLLGSAGVAEQKAGSTTMGTDIPGLAPRVGRPLEFLGLYGTSHAACRRHDIPAKRVTPILNSSYTACIQKGIFEIPSIYFA